MILQIGKVIRTKGLKGEIITFFYFSKIIPVKNDVLFFEKNYTLFGPYNIEQLKLYKKNFYLLKLQEINKISESEKIVSSIIGKSFDKIPENIILTDDIIGCKVIIASEVEKNFGIVSEVIKIPNKYSLLVVKNVYSKEEFYIPFIKEIVKIVDTKQKIIYVNPVNGISVL